MITGKPLGGISSHNLNYHSDVSVSGISINDLLVYSGGSWGNNNISALGIITAGDLSSYLTTNEIISGYLKLDCSNDPLTGQLTIDIDSASKYFSVVDTDVERFSWERASLFGNTLYRFTVNDYVGDPTMVFGYAPLVDLGGGFVLDDVTIFSIAESDKAENLGSLGAMFTANDRDGWQVIGFVVQSTFAEHRLDLGSDQSNPTYSPYLVFSDSGEYDGDTGYANVSYRFHYDRTNYMLRAFGSMPPGGQSHTHPLPGIIFGGYRENDAAGFGGVEGEPTAISNHGLGSNDVVIVVSADGSDGGDFEVQGKSYFDDDVTVSSGQLIIPIIQDPSPTIASLRANIVDKCLEFYDGSEWQSADCPTMVKVIDTSVSEGNNSVTSFENKVLIKAIKIATTSTSWGLTLYESDNYSMSPYEIVPSGVGNGNHVIYLDFPYEDQDSTSEFHYNFQSLSGSETHDIEIRGIKLR